ncbi:MAG: hypothetical protein K8S27_03740 [Candidatus Omnitrophica bacterium]|nr:hypothetical protein [Candidatus Omnitrophota bacterium]
MRRIVLMIIIFFVSGSFAAAQDIDGQPNRARVQDGKIVIETPGGTNVVDYKAKKKYRSVSPRKWKVEKQRDPVTEALRIYEEKSKPLYTYRVFLSYRGQQEPSIIFSYKSTEDDSEVIFSPDENFLYYIDVSGEGTRIIHGLNLKTSRDFEIGPGDELDLIHCPDKNYYVVIEEGSDVSYHTIYRSTGERVNILNKRENIEDLVPFICY